MKHKLRGMRVDEYAYYVNKLRQNVGLETWIWRHKHRTPNTNDHHMPLNDPPLHENFLRTPLFRSFNSGNGGEILWSEAEVPKSLGLDTYCKYCDASPNTARDLERLLEIYQEDIGPRASVVPEVQRWVNKWKKEDVSTVLSSAIEALCACHADIDPNVYILLTILGTLPVSTAASERSFSTMRRLKTCLRSSIGNEWMTGLALLSIHEGRRIDREKILNDFVASSNRRSDFVL